MKPEAGENTNQHTPNPNLDLEGISACLKGDGPFEEKQRKLDELARRMKAADITIRTSAQKILEDHVDLFVEWLENIEQLTFEACYGLFALEKLHAVGSQSLTPILQGFRDGLKRKNFTKGQARLASSILGQRGPCEELYPDIQTLIQEAGLPSSALYEWSCTVNQEIPNNWSKVLTENLLRVMEMETRAPGAIKVLAEEFGLRTLARYPVEVLINQFENREVHSPYGVAVYPRTDHNGAFYKTGPLLQQMQEDLTVHGHLLRIIECGEKTEINQRLKGLDHRYSEDRGATGDGHKLEFLMLAAHGDPEAICLGVKWNVGKLEIPDVAGEQGASLASYLKPNGTILFNSCSTGQTGGIAHILSYSLPLGEVWAPRAETGIKNIGITARTTGLQFTPQYRDPQATARFPIRGSF